MLWLVQNVCRGMTDDTQTATRLTMPTHPWQNECFITTELLVWRWGHRGVKHLCIWHFTHCCFNELGEGRFEGLLSLWCLHWITTFFISILPLRFIYFNLKNLKYITRSLPALQVWTSTVFLRKLISLLSSYQKSFIAEAVSFTTTGKLREDSCRRMKEGERHGNEKINSLTFCFCQFPVVAPLLSLLFPSFALSPVSDESFLEG